MDKETQASEKDGNVAEKSTSSARWWEFYAIRYAMGTVIGAIVVLVLCSVDPHLNLLLLGMASSVVIEGGRITVNFDVGHAVLLAAIGLVYCYVASGPILVFHAGRFMLKPNGLVRWIGPSLGIGALIVLAVALFGNAAILVSAAVTAFVVILIVEYMVAAFTLWSSHANYLFYKRLTAARGDVRLGKKEAVGELKESYRHLREHGNSFFIVFLEVVLGAALVIAERQWQSDPRLILIMVVWILASVAIWTVATQFEREFAMDDDFGQVHATHPKHASGAQEKGGQGADVPERSSGRR